MMLIAEIIKKKQPQVYALLVRQYGIEFNVYGDRRRVCLLLGADYMYADREFWECKQLMEEKKGVLL